MTGAPLIVAGVLTNRNTGHRHDQSVAESNHGSGVTVEIGYNPIVASDGRPIFTMESYLERHGLSLADFPGRKLSLVPSESVGLVHVHFDDAKNPRRETGTMPALGFYLLISKPE